jgi:hypothetical protein
VRVGRDRLGVEPQHLLECTLRLCQQMHLGKRQTQIVVVDGIVRLQVACSSAPIFDKAAPSAR